MFHHRNTQDRVFEDYFLRTPIHLASPSAIIQFKIILDNSLHVAIMKFKFLGFKKKHNDYCIYHGGFNINLHFLIIKTVEISNFYTPE